MEIDIVITNDRFNEKSYPNGLSFIKLISEDKSLISVIEENPEEIELLTNSKMSNDIESLISKHLTLNSDFALKLNILDSMDCTCLEGKSKLGFVIQNIMIDNYQLILTRKHWREINKLSLFFDAVDYGSIDDFIEYSLKRNKSKKA